MSSIQPPSASPLPKLFAVAHGLTDRGMQREHNEDSFSVLNEFGLFIVADGMGGHLAGDVASQLATETISEFFRSTASEDVTWPFHFDTNLTEEENRLLTGIRVANRQILDRSEKSPDCHGMGTTVVGAMFSPTKSKLFIGHVGDSRCYRVRQGQLQLLTRDHSLINDYITAIPNLTDEQKAGLPRNVITRALGMSKDVVVDLQVDEPQSGDVYVLCSDGLNGMLRDSEILEIVAESAGDIPYSARKLIDRANANGGEDNITVVLIRFDDAKSEYSSSRISSPTFVEDDTVSGQLVPTIPAPASLSDSKIPSPLPGPVAPPSEPLFQDEDTLVSGELPRKLTSPSA